MSRATLIFLRDLLRQVSLSADAANLEEQAAMISRVRSELDDAIAAAPDTPPPPADA